jgi:hypothetical protein
MPKVRVNTFISPVVMVNTDIVNSKSSLKIGELVMNLSTLSKVEPSLPTLFLLSKKVSKKLSKRYYRRLSGS